MAKREDITLEQWTSAPPPLVWAALTRPALWWNNGVTLDPRIGGHFFEPWSDGVVSHRTTGTITELDPPRLLSLTWRDDDWGFETNVAFTMTSREGGTLISLRHSGWEGASAEEQAQLVPDHRHGWLGHLRNLAACASGLIDSE